MVNFDDNRFPNPPGSPLEKLATENLLEQIEPQVRARLSAQPSRQEVLSAFNYLDETVKSYLARHNRLLEQWANIHTHEFSGGGGGAWVERGLISVLTTTRRTTSGTAPSWETFAAPPGTLQNGRLVRIAENEILGLSASNIQTYDPLADAWATDRAPHPTGGLTFCAMDYAEGLLYAAGGQLGSTAQTATFVYDVAADTWTSLAPMPLATGQAPGVMLNGRLHVLGGITAGTTPRNTHYVYDPDTDAWSTATVLPKADRLGGAIVRGGEIYYVASATGGVGSLFRYSPDTDSWSLLANRPGTTSSVWVRRFDGLIYALVAGANLFEYDLDADAWTIRSGPGLSTGAPLMTF
jgi:hypothetical protein